MVDLKLILARYWGFLSIKRFIIYKILICFNVWVVCRLASAVQAFQKCNFFWSIFKPQNAILTSSRYTELLFSWKRQFNFWRFLIIKYNILTFIIKKHQTSPKHLKQALVFRDYCLALCKVLNVRNFVFSVSGEFTKNAHFANLTHSDILLRSWLKFELVLLLCSHIFAPLLLWIMQTEVLQQM